jgi:hypothetical protein
MNSSIKVGSYLVLFDNQGATIEHCSCDARYRVNAQTATNPLDFTRHQTDLCFAMVENHPQDLEVYREQNGAPHTAACPSQVEPAQTSR